MNANDKIICALSALSTKSGVKLGPFHESGNEIRVNTRAEYDSNGVVTLPASTLTAYLSTGYVVVEPFVWDSVGGRYVQPGRNSREAMRIRVRMGLPAQDWVDSLLN